MKYQREGFRTDAFFIYRIMGVSSRAIDKVYASQPEPWRDMGGVDMFDTMERAYDKTYGNDFYYSIDSIAFWILGNRKHAEITSRWQGIFSCP